MPRCLNVYDIVRGALVYETMSGVLAAGKALMNHDKFIVHRLKNRFYPRCTATACQLPPHACYIVSLWCAHVMRLLFSAFQ